MPVCFPAALTARSYLVALRRDPNHSPCTQPQTRLTMHSNRPQPTPDIHRPLTRPPHAATGSRCPTAGACRPSLGGALRRVMRISMPLAVWMVAPVAMPICGAREGGGRAGWVEQAYGM